MAVDSVAIPDCLLLPDCTFFLYELSPGEMSPGALSPGWTWAEHEGGATQYPRKWTRQQCQRLKTVPQI